MSGVYAFGPSVGREASAAPGSPEASRLRWAVARAARSRGARLAEHACESCRELYVMTDVDLSEREAEEFARSVAVAVSEAGWTVYLGRAERLREVADGYASANLLCLRCASVLAVCRGCIASHMDSQRAGLAAGGPRAAQAWATHCPACEGNPCCPAGYA